MDGDDPWLDEDVVDESVLQHNSAQQWERLSAKFSDAGYREGITAGRQSTLQAGFDEGYSKTGAILGRELGYLRGVASSLVVYLTSPASTEVHNKESVVESARELVRRLGKLRIQDIAPKDLEAEQHALEHGEELVIPPELQEKRDMQSLEDGLEGMLHVNAKEQQQGPQGKVEMDACRSHLEGILVQVGLEALLRP